MKLDAEEIKLERRKRKKRKIEKSRRHKYKEDLRTSFQRWVVHWVIRVNFLAEETKISGQNIKIILFKVSNR